jgi:hypothetical protein
MHIEALRLVATEGDLNELAYKFLPPHGKVRGLHVAIVPRGVRVTGTYQSAIALPFETLWEVLVCEGKLAARLLTLKTGFLSMGLAKSYVIGAIAAAARMVKLREDMLLVDVDALFRDRGLSLRTNLSSVRCDYGSLVIRSGRSD